MNKYKLTALLPAGVTAAKKKNLQEKVEALVKSLKGKVTKVDDWGDIDLQYVIKKNKAANFVNYELELESNAVKKMNDKLRLEDAIIRHLVVRSEN